MKKRRFAIGGFSDIDEGRDTPDQALARKASDSKYANDASDKAAGLASKGEDVGFFKRLGMGNIDDASSEANQQFGAGKTRLANIVPPRPRESMGKTEGMPTPVAVPRPIPTVSKPMIPPTPVGNMANVANMPSNRYTDEGPSPEVAKPKMNMGTAEGFKESGLTRREYLNKINNLKPRSNPSVAAPKVKAPVAAPSNRVQELTKKLPSSNTDSIDLLKPSKPKSKLNDEENTDTSDMSFNKKGGKIRAYASGGSVSSRADGCAQRGKTRGMMR